MANRSHSRPAGCSLDDIARDHAIASALPADAVEALLVEHATVGQVLLARLLALRADRRSEPAAPRFIDAKTAAAQWQVPKSWIYDQARRGNLPSVDLGRYVRFRPEDLERFIADHRQGA